MVLPSAKGKLSLAYDMLRLPKMSRPWRALAFGLVALLALPYALTPLYAVVEPTSTLMIWRRMTGARVERVYVPLDWVSRSLPRAVLVAEDARFCTHRGIDFLSLRDAIEEAEDLDELRGGSTITQQVAKNLFLWQGRSFVRKALEFPLALWIDLVLSKRRILEIYLNIAEWGPNGEFGIEAGSRYAFRRSARELSPHQAALLAAVLPNPARRNARAPGPGLRRLAGLYRARAARASGVVGCITKGR